MLAEFSVIPIGEGVSVSPHVAKVAKIIDESGLDYRINPMATVPARPARRSGRPARLCHSGGQSGGVEGEMDELFALIKKYHQAVMEDVQRVIITVVMDDRKDRQPPRLDKKVASVEEKVGRTLKK